MPFNYGSKTFKLYHQFKLIGTITKLGTDQPWFVGTIAVTEAIEEHRDRFAKEFRKRFADDYDAEVAPVGEPPMSVPECTIEDDTGNRTPGRLLVIRRDDVMWSM